ncbi:MAG: DNA polymerase, partial [Nitrosopumilus sp.]
SDRLSHDLKTLSREYLGYDTGSQDRVQDFLKETFAAEHWHNYAKVPIDILGEYACDDVLMNRKLYKFLMEKLDEEQNSLWETEKKLTSILFDMEYIGLRTDKKECMIESYKALHNMITASNTISELADREFTNSSKCIYDILINQFDMPVIATIKEKEKGREVDTGRPTFDSDALALYGVHPMALADKKLSEIIKAITIYRKESQFKSLYPDSFQILADDDMMIHTTYNQTVRTGRMSAKRPNSQQQNKRSKALIHPRIGYGFISCDYSQIEFRLIVHYIKDVALIKAYNEDPSTDFHQWVADMMLVTRPVGKTLNFGMAYGAGKRKVINDLISNPDVIEEMSIRVNVMLDKGEISVEERDEIFRKLCRIHAGSAFETYHEKIPSLKGTSDRAANACKMRGYIFNAYGRRRHLPNRASYKAFNSLIQSCAMDLMKERMVALSPRFNKKMKDWDIRLAANVHDELLFECPLVLIHNKEVKDYIVSMLESPSIEFRVPIITGYSVSEKDWAEAGS